MAADSSGHRDRPTKAEKNIVEKLVRLRRAMGIPGTDLAASAELSDSVVSQIESGNRKPTEANLHSIGRALGIKDTDWSREWAWCRFMHVDPEAYEKRLDQHDESAIKTRTAPDNPHAHQDMIKAGHYRYVSIEEAAENSLKVNILASYLEENPGDHHGAYLRAERLARPIFEGEAALQCVVFETLNRNLAELVLDRHDGVEFMIVLEGEMDFVVLRQPEFEGDPPLLIKGESCIDNHDCKALVAAGLFHGWINQLYKMAKRTRQEDQLYNYIKHEYGAAFGRKTPAAVPCEVIHLHPNSVLVYRSDWPHGFTARRGKARGIFVTYRSFVGVSTEADLK
jgi:transcriptional regulator with XRE-family HTH domain